MIRSSAVSVVGLVIVASVGTRPAKTHAADPLPPAEAVTPPVQQSTQVHSVAFSPTGLQVATGDEKAAYLWDAASGKLLAELKDADHVQGMAFSPDGAQLLTGSFDKTARVLEGAAELALSAR